MKRVASTILMGVAVWLGVSGLPADVRSEGSSAYLKPVEVRPLPDGVQLVLGFQGKGRMIPRLDDKALSHGEGWSQIQIPGAVLDPPKQSLRLETGPLTEVFAYQFTPEAVRVRLYHRDPRNGGEGRVSLKPEAGETVVTVLEKRLPKRDPFVPAGPSRKSAVPSEVPAKDPIPAAVAGQTREVAPNAGAVPPIAETPAVSLPTVLPPEPIPPPASSVESLRLAGKANELPPPFVVGDGAPDLLSTSLKMVLALVLVLLLMGGCVYVFKRTLGRRMGLAGGKDRQIRVLSSAYLGPKKNIVLVEVAGETLVLGVSGERISLLSRIIPEGERMPEPESESPAFSAPGEPAGDPRFDRMLRSIGGDNVTLGDDLWASRES